MRVMFVFSFLHPSFFIGAKMKNEHMQIRVNGLDIELILRYNTTRYGNSMVERVATGMIFSMVVLVTNNVKDLVTITVTF